MDGEIENEREAEAAPSPEPLEGRADQASKTERVLNVVLIAVFGGVTALALFLSPDPSGVGTHTQLGLPPCGLYQRYGIPCLSCGMTTSFAHMVRFQVVRAFLANPLGAILYTVFLVGAVMNLFGAVSGWSFFRFLERWDWTRLGLLFVFLSLASWGYKVAAVLLARS